MTGAAAWARVAPFDWAGLAQDGVQAIRRLMPGDSAPCLLRSWDVEAWGDFARTHRDTAYVYDNALAGLALLAMGDVSAARRIGTALALCQDKDRYWQDGRLRNAYAAGPVTGRLPGWWDNAAGRWVEDGYQVGSATGVVAWAALLWLELAEVTRDAQYRLAAERAADWIEATQAGPRGYRGGTVGHEPAPQALAWVSTEHNIDLELVFTRLKRPAAAAHAAAFVDSMWDAGQGRYLAGLLPDGALNHASMLDANLWPLIARGMPRDRGRGLAWVMARHAVGDGLDFNDDRDGGWSEGTAFAALALRLAGDETAAGVLAGFLARQRAASGLLYATDVAALSTGLSTGLDPSRDDFRYPRLPHLAPTSWSVLAAMRFNPFTGRA